MHRITILIAATAASLALAGCPTEPPAVDDSIFAADPLETSIVSARVDNGDGTSHTRDVPCDQILLMFSAATSRAAARDTLSRIVQDEAALGAVLVGQVPDLGIYQVQIANSPSDPVAAMAQLDAAMERLRGYAGVETVGYNELLASRTFEVADDNSAYRYNDRCCFSVIDYYQAVPLLDSALAAVSLSDVSVAVIDSGLWVDSDQFDEILPRTTFVNPPVDSTPYDWHLFKHGTNIAALLAADNGDGFTNGVALRLLGDRLHLIVGDAHIWGELYSLVRAISTSRQAVLAGADVVNLSFGSNAGGRTPRWLRDAQAQFSRLFDESPDVLFIAAASNDRLVLNGNDVPSGMPNANLLTVGGLQSCDTEVAYLQSATGPGIEIAAPATGIPGFVGDNLTGPAGYMHDGNSFAAPLVAAMALVLKSINPGLDGAGLKTRLLDEDQTWPAPAAVGGRRPALIKTIATVLLRDGGSATYDGLLDAFGPPDDISDPVGYSVNRRAAAIEFHVTGPAHDVEIDLAEEEVAWNSDSLNYGVIGLGGQVVLGMAASASSDRVTISTTSGFRLDEPYTEGLQIYVQTPDGFHTTGIDGGTGTFELCDCELTTRSLPLDWYSPDNPGPHQLVYIQVDGTFSGTNHGMARLSDGKVTHGVSFSASGSFSTAFALIDVDADTIRYLEEHCTGGLVRPE